MAEMLITSAEETRRCTATAAMGQLYRDLYREFGMTPQGGEGLYGEWKYAMRPDVPFMNLVFQMRIGFARYNRYVRYPLEDPQQFTVRQGAVTHLGAEAMHHILGIVEDVREQTFLPIAERQ